MSTKTNTKKAARKTASKATKKVASKSTKKVAAKKPAVKAVVKKARATAKKTAKKTVRKAVSKTTPKKARSKIVTTAKKKATAKKTTAHKTTKLLVCAQDGHCFWTTDGQVLRDMNDLKLALGQMDDTVFMYHVSEDKNDFADWVEHVLEDAACAEALRACQTPKKAKSIVTTHLRYYLI